MRRIQGGRTLVTVRAGSRYDEAEAMIRRWGGHAQTPGRSLAHLPHGSGHRTHEMPIRREDVVTEQPRPTSETRLRRAEKHRQQAARCSRGLLPFLFCREAYCGSS